MFICFDFYQNVFCRSIYCSFIFHLQFVLALTDDLLQLVVRKLKKKDKLKGVGKWECEVGQDWSTHGDVEVEGISESAGNVSVN